MCHELSGDRNANIQCVSSSLEILTQISNVSQALWRTKHTFPLCSNLKQIRRQICSQAETSKVSVILDIQRNPERLVCTVETSMHISKETTLLGLDSEYTDVKSLKRWLWQIICTKKAMQFQLQLQDKDCQQTVSNQRVGFLEMASE